MKNVYKSVRTKLRLNPLIQRSRRLLSSPFAATDLPFILTHLDPRSTFQEQIYWMEQLFNWIGSTGELPSETEIANKSSIQIVRIKFLLHLLNRNSVWKTNLAAVLRNIIRDSSSLELFSQTGLHQEFGFWGEAADRIIKKVLPLPPNDANLAELFSRVFNDTDSAIWVEEISGDLALQIADLICFEAEDQDAIFYRIYRDIQEAIVVLSAVIGGMGLSKDLLRSKTRVPHNSPFYLLSFHVNKLIAKMSDDFDPLDLVEAINPCLQEMSECRKEIKQIFLTLEEKGVSLAVVYRLDQLQFAVNRIETLVHLLLLKRDRDSLNIVVHFISELIREQGESLGLMSLFKSNLRLLSKKIVERTGVTGEHYITSNRTEYVAMLKSGFGGGVLTVGTTLVKTVVSSLKLPFFWDFFGIGVNYAGSFVAIQLCGFTLATKQPSATAAHLASKLEGINTQESLEEFIQEFKKISRSQFAAAVGNIGMAMPASALAYITYYTLTGHPVFNAEYAEYTLHSLNPIQSFTIIFAALTGVWLWLSSIAGGWVENWIVYRRIPDAIAQHRGLRARLGPKRTERFADWLAHNATGLGSNTCLGFLLAGLPVLGRIFGIALDVRHVTLSTCAATIAVCSLAKTDLHWESVGMAALGILLIGLLNFGVSFYLALTVAARARSLNQSTVFFLFRQVFRAFLNGPREFFFPR